MIELEINRSKEDGDSIDAGRNFGDSRQGTPPGSKIIRRPMSLRGGSSHMPAMPETCPNLGLRTRALALLRHVRHNLGRGSPHARSCFRDRIFRTAGTYTRTRPAMFDDKAITLRAHQKGLSAHTTHKRRRPDDSPRRERAPGKNTGAVCFPKFRLLCLTIRFRL